MTHSTAVLFAHVGTWLLRLPAADKRLEDGRPEGEAKSPTPVLFAGERDRLPPRDESFYSAWQYWSQ
ncbi:hypothetical protein EN802_31205 [bacterium M00.F.Ca.ET.159.01.1.1]|nr:hypothetical protein EN873_41830 [bacterium M00.F.Ca.ET.230.01.1.1]TGT65922.1 hypothetical protein EN802_31205 [bacterium M00.F.Ca.ET.159.01.1.1]TGT79598.1 hypothetical protein EN800_30545 [bacterium M00.F.Ca.ET.157.01.1.1]